MPHAVRVEQPRDANTDTTSGMLRMGMGELQLSLESKMDEILKAWLGATPGMRGMRHESFFW